jgi:hypothetical protein
MVTLVLSGWSARRLDGQQGGKRQQSHFYIDCSSVRSFKKKKKKKKKLGEENQAGCRASVARSSWQL